MEATDRRSFLKSAGNVAGLAGLAGIGATGLAGCPPVEEGEPYKIPAWPWVYGPLDVEQVRKLGHKGYYAGGCSYGAFEAIVGALRDLIGDPYDKVITDMMRYGGGGVAGFGSLCGALNGAAAAIGLVCDKAAQTALVGELLAWYAATPLPTDESNEYAVNGEFLVDQLKYEGPIVQNAAGGNLCHMSVTNWCLTAGVAESAPMRLERCARLTGDVAAKAVELLNAHYAGTFAPAIPVPSASASCRACHTDGGMATVLDYTNGKMDCDLCHGPHEWK
jgi:hypothetical protein